MKTIIRRKDGHAQRYHTAEKYMTVQQILNYVNVKNRGRISSVMEMKLMGKHYYQLNFRNGKVEIINIKRR